MVLAARAPSLCALLAALVCAGDAGAVSLTMQTVKSVYSVGETIVITLEGDTTGASPRSTVFVTVTYDDLLVTPPLAASQGPPITSYGGFIPWSTANPLCGPTQCTVLNQLAGANPQPPDPVVVVGTLLLSASQAGALSLGTGHDFRWFGAPAPPGITITIVPEPGTGLLVLLGLLALARVRS